MRATAVSFPDGMTRTFAPGRTDPLVTNPEKPRKSAFGRLTHCTGIRNGCAAGPASISTFSRWASSVGPAYQGAAAAG